MNALNRFIRERYDEKVESLTNIDNHNIKKYAFDIVFQHLNASTDYSTLYYLIAGKQLEQTYSFVDFSQSWSFNTVS